MSEPQHTTLTDYTADTEPSGTVAIDLETIDLVDDPDFRDPSDWEVFAVALGYHPGNVDNSPDTAVESDVLIKNDRSDCGEMRLFERVIEWVSDRNPERILTYNGDSYDIPILQHRAYECAGTCWDMIDTAHDLNDLLEAIPHRDLMNDVVEDVGHYSSLENELERHDISWDHISYGGSVVSGAEMPAYGRVILDPDTSAEHRQELENVVRMYARSDVEPLFSLFDSLRE